MYIISVNLSYILEVVFEKKDSCKISNVFFVDAYHQSFFYIFSLQGFQEKIFGIVN